MPREPPVKDKSLDAPELIGFGTADAEVAGEDKVFTAVIVREEEHVVVLHVPSALT